MARGIASWFGGDDDEPKQEAPAAPQYKTAQQLFDEAMGYAKTNYPQAYGARESALGDIAKGNAYYESFQPTSFEQALGNRNFQDIDRIIKQSLSMSGMESSPILAEQRAKAGTDIGEFLTNLGNERARYSLNERMRIDPDAVMSSFLDTNMGQSNLQTGSDYENALLKASIDYQNALKEYQNKQAGITGGMGLAGGGIGALIAAGLAIPTGGLSLAAIPAMASAGLSGGMMGSSIASGMAPLFGGSAGGGINIGDALSMYQMLNPGAGKPQAVSTGKVIEPYSSNISGKEYYPTDFDYNFESFAPSRNKASIAGIPYASNLDMW